MSEPEQKKTTDLPHPLLRTGNTKAKLLKVLTIMMTDPTITEAERSDLSRAVGRVVVDFK